MQVPKELKFIKSGYLNMVCLRNGKEVKKIDVPQDFVYNDEIVKSNSMDGVTFAPNAVFKVTLEFKKQLPCSTGTAVREGTDWVLVSGTGPMAYFDKTEEKLILQQCVVCIESNVEPLLVPFHLALGYDGEQWVVQRVWR